MDGELDPARYEALTGISKDAYEQRLLEATRYALMEQLVEVDFDENEISHGTVRGALRRDGGVVEAVQLAGDADDRHLVVLFRLEACPGVLFGSRAPIWPAPEPNEVIASPEDLGGMMYVYLDETVCSTSPDQLAAAPDERGVAWTTPLT